MIFPRRDTLESEEKGKGGFGVCLIFLAEGHDRYAVFLVWLTFIYRSGSCMEENRKAGRFPHSICEGRLCIRVH